MNFDDLFENFIILVVVLQFFWGFIKKFIKQPEQQAAAAEGGVDVVHWQRDLRHRLQSTVALGEQLDSRLQGFNLSHASDLDDLRAVIRPTRRALDQALAQLRPIEALAQQESPEAMVALVERGSEINAAFVVVSDARQRVEIIERLVEARQGGSQAYLADADAVARALIAPLQAFAQAEGIGLPKERPICVPAGEHGESVLLGLFAAHPVIFVPHDFQHELLRWASVAHEVGHVLWRGIPGLREEAGRVTGFAYVISPLPSVQNRQIIFDPQTTLAAWLEELVCDLLTVMLLGPAGLRGAIHVFSHPGDPDEVAWCHSQDGRRFDAHPPHDLRIRLSAWSLDRMGFHREAKHLLAAWRELHGEQETAIVPTTFGQAIGVPMAEFETHGRRLLTTLFEHSWESLAGRSLESINGLSMGPGLWAKVMSHTKLLTTNQPFNTDPRVVVAAAIMAAAASPTEQATIGARARAAIHATGERWAEDPNYSTAAPSGSHSTLLRDAVVMADILTRRPVGPRRPRR